MSIIIDKERIFIVIPAFNENSCINDTIKDVKAYGFTVVIVDDGSSIPLQSNLINTNLYLVRHPINLGQGAALQTGIEFSLMKGANMIVTFDADGQHLAEDINKLLDLLLNSNSDIVFGSRFLAGSFHNMTMLRKLLIKGACYINYTLTGILLTDAHNGLRAINRKAAEKIKLTENGMAHATEILQQVKKHKLKYMEVPVRIRYTDYSLKKGQSLWNSFRILFDLFLNKIIR